MSRGTMLGAAAAAVALVAGAAVAVGSTDSDGAGPDGPGADPAARATAAVTRGDLVDTTSASGSLGYADSRTLGTDLAGTLTWLPPAGRVVREGQPLYRVDRTPVVRLDGTVPAWRDLGPGVSDGEDVRQLEAALEDLGYPHGYDLGVDGEWTWVTTLAVRQWQEDRGLEETGELPLGTVVFSDGDLRVTGRLADLGARLQPGAEVLEVSDRRRRITVTLDPSQRHLAPVGGRVDLELPDGSTVRGRITEVEAVPAADDTAEETLSVTVEATGRRSMRKLGTQLDGASVLVTFHDTVATGVLTVPVTALVALTGGGYAVEVVRGSGTELVPVETGAFADTSVAVRGDLREGDEVVVTP